MSQVEFKRDPRDGRFCLMEINARHWKWHGLAARCGVNLSYVAYRDAIGDPYLARRQRDGVKWIVANKDVPLALLEIGAGARRASIRALAARHAHGRTARARRPVAGPAQRGHRHEAGTHGRAERRVDV